MASAASGYPVRCAATAAALSCRIPPSPSWARIVTAILVIRLSAILVLQSLRPTAKDNDEYDKEGGSNQRENRGHLVGGHGLHGRHCNQQSLIISFNLDLILRCFRGVVVMILRQRRRLFFLASTKLGTYGFRGGKGSGFGVELGEGFPDRPQRRGERVGLGSEL